jgi:hypothetical protein
MARGNGETTRGAVGHGAVNGKRTGPIQRTRRKRPPLVFNDF